MKLRHISQFTVYKVPQGTGYLYFVRHKTKQPDITGCGPTKKTAFRNWEDKRAHRLDYLKDIMEERNRSIYLEEYKDSHRIRLTTGTRSEVATGTFTKLGTVYER